MRLREQHVLAAHHRCVRAVEQALVPGSVGEAPASQPRRKCVATAWRARRDVCKRPAARCSTVRPVATRRGAPALAVCAEPGRHTASNPRRPLRQRIRRAVPVRPLPPDTTGRYGTAVPSDRRGGRSGAGRLDGPLLPLHPLPRLQVRRRIRRYLRRHAGSRLTGCMPLGRKLRWGTRSTPTGYSEYSHGVLGCRWEGSMRTRR